MTTQRRNRFIILAETIEAWEQGPKTKRPQRSLAVEWDRMQRNDIEEMTALVIVAARRNGHVSAEEWAAMRFVKASTRAWWDWICELRQRVLGTTIYFFDQSPEECRAEKARLRYLCGDLAPAPKRPEPLFKPQPIAPPQPPKQPTAATDPDFAKALRLAAMVLLMLANQPPTATPEHLTPKEFARLTPAQQDAYLDALERRLAHMTPTAKPVQPPDADPEREGPEWVDHPDQAHCDATAAELLADVVVDIGHLVD